MGDVLAVLVMFVGVYVLGWAHAVGVEYRKRGAFLVSLKEWGDDRTMIGVYERWEVSMHQPTRHPLDRLLHFIARAQEDER